MKKPSSKIREEIARLQEQLKAAESREAERIGRLALWSGFGDIEILNTELIAAFEEIAGGFRKGSGRGGKAAAATAAAVTPGTAPGQAGEV